ncbi:MAG TPA: type II toxin-antitoxin system RelE/ParE family toxin [Nitrospiraceae bacterium]|nr:type II toxin-antitoxin system RelE/ParE family toxin [Nitrospiraceae bacterium]
MGEIKWTEKASSHLQSIHDYIAIDSKTYASRFIKSLIKATIKLEKMPRCGRIVPELESYGFREVIFRNYRIVYIVSEGRNDVEILAVVHGAREIKTVFQEEWEL